MLFNKKNKSIRRLGNRFPKRRMLFMMFFKKKTLALFG
ncbi:hypothetical protein FM121_03435 [Vagococcus fluvialis bH819]|uniref:Uncharacterized protein n=1 Tax=Vagococcus fluvialis bH819 TaxID=1255619 RepID=A0A1X6WLC7_9ENTE|nr:hypothetical protein FM121_03435 [Vagococcus fluvialis bH819]